MTRANPMLLIGDNPFLGVSHLSQARSRARGASVLTPGYAASVVMAAISSGAEGFLFSINNTTLEILRELRRNRQPCPALYPIVPYAYEYVRSAVALGGIPGLARSIGGEIVRSWSWRAAFLACLGAVAGDPGPLMQAYVRYELARLHRATDRNRAIASILLHEIVTDMALALDMEWLFRAFMNEAAAASITAGFNTRNLALLIWRLKQWGIPLRGLVFAAPFNAIGFQMSPSQKACEHALEGLSGATVIAFGVLAAGSVQPEDAIAYLTTLPNLAGVAVGASTPDQARHTFGVFSAYLRRCAPVAVREPS